GRPLVIERFNAGQAIARGGAIVPRTALREAQSDVEFRALDILRNREGVNPTPTRDEALNILRERVNAERQVRQADAHALRPDYVDNNAIQQTEFDLRREAALGLLRATNRTFSEGTTGQLANVQPLAGARTVASLENLPTLREANDVAHALAGSGFENVR